ncbi:hypothetical protein MPSEU_000223600 [Mayamaea pseudoterrestris]|nr:hypothetical protein MPSEU_000223600 [Mayamaea pseudoterrestris]
MKQSKLSCSSKHQQSPAMTLTRPKESRNLHHYFPAMQQQQQRYKTEQSRASSRAGVAMNNQRQHQQQSGAKSIAHESSHVERHAARNQQQQQPVNPQLVIEIIDDDDDDDAPLYCWSPAKATSKHGNEGLNGTHHNHGAVVEHRSVKSSNSNGRTLAAAASAAPASHERHTLAIGSKPSHSPAKTHHEELRDLNGTHNIMSDARLQLSASSRILNGTHNSHGAVAAHRSAHPPPKGRTLAASASSTSHERRTLATVGKQSHTPAKTHHEESRDLNGAHNNHGAVVEHCSVNVPTGSTHAAAASAASHERRMLATGSKPSHHKRSPFARRKRANDVFMKTATSSSASKRQRFNVHASKATRNDVPSNQSPAAANYFTLSDNESDEQTVHAQQQSIQRQELRDIEPAATQYADSAQRKPVVSQQVQRPLALAEKHHGSRTHGNQKLGVAESDSRNSLSATHTLNARAPLPVFATNAIHADGIRATAGPLTAEQLQQQVAHLQELPEHVDSELYTLDEFITIAKAMCRTITNTKEVKEKDPLVAIEKGICRNANYNIKGNREIQQKAQYGRVTFPAIEKLFRKDYFHLKPDDVFLDLGHGIRLPSFQAAYTVGCESRGIELDDDRFLVSQVFEGMFKDQLQAIQNECLLHRQGFLPPTGGKMIFKQGSLSDFKQVDFLTNQGRVTKCLVNNFDGVFADRSKSKEGGSKYCLDNFVAALFARMDPESIMITLHPLDLGRCCIEAAKLRHLHQLTFQPNASFYVMEELILGPQKDTVSWSSHSTVPLTVYKYTRKGESTFVCCNATCDKRNVRQQATEIRTLKGGYPDETTREEDMVMVIRSCDCMQNIRSIRQRKPPRIS